MKNNTLFCTILLSTAIMHTVDTVAQGKNGKVYTIDTLKNINTEYNDYCPAISGQKLIFISQQAISKSVFPVIESEKDFSNIYRTIISREGQKEFESIDFFSGRINSFFNEGPASFAGKDSVMFITKSEKIAYDKEEAKLKIMQSEYSNNGWSVPVELPFIKDEYNYAHPAWSKEYSTLYFSSDIPGGYGGMDIWYCEFENGSWKEPLNAGENINSPYNELFPSYFANDLYFSSNLPESLGGLDIYKSSVLFGFHNKEQLPQPLNSAQDDFGISFYNKKTAYFTSNRPGGKGGDDLYLLNILDQNSMFMVLTGSFINFDSTLVGESILLYDAHGNVLQKIIMNERGKFLLNEMPAGEQFKLAYEDSPEIDDSMILVLTDDSGRILEKIRLNRFNEFLFELLDPDDYDNLTYLEEVDVGILNIDIQGTIVPKDTLESNEGITVYVEDADGKILGKAYTDSLGSFKIENLNPDERYFLKTNRDANINLIYIIDKSGKIIRTLEKRGDDDCFVYIRLTDNDKIITLIDNDNSSIKVSDQEKFQISDIYYDLNSFSPTPESLVVIDKLAAILKNNPHIALELGAHTDARGNELFNQQLSEKRALFVKDYLDKIGVEKGRITAKGFGESRPFKLCQPQGSCTEEDHALNRRTEIKLKHAIK